MARKPESILRKKIHERLCKIPYSYWEIIEQESIRGTADIIGCLCGAFYWIEVKVDFAAVLAPREPLQMYKMTKVIAAQGSGLLMTKDTWEFHCHRLNQRALHFAQLRQSPHLLPKEFTD